MKILVKFLLIPVFALFFSLAMYAQPQTPPPPPPGHGGSGNQPAGGASPIGAGIGLLLLMAGAYGARKVYNAREKLND